MANLNTKTIAAGVGDILAIADGVDGSTARQVKDGDGTATPLWLTTTKLGLGTAVPPNDLSVASNDGGMIALLRDDTAILSANALGQIVFGGDDPVDGTFQEGAAITAIADENWGSGACGGALIFKTVDNTTTTLDNRMVILNNGRIGIGTTQPAGWLHVGTTDDNWSADSAQNLVLGSTTGIEWLASSSGNGYGMKIEDDGVSGSEQYYKVQTRVNASAWNAVPAISIQTSSDSTKNNFVGFGVAVPLSQVHIEDDTVTKYPLRVVNAGAEPRGLLIDNQQATNTADDDFFIAITSSVATMYRISGDGDVENNTGNAIAAISDERLKENIADYTGGLAVLDGLKPRTFTWKSGVDRGMAGTRYGFIAQEVVGTTGVTDAMGMARKGSVTEDDTENIKALCDDGVLYKSNLNAFQCVLISAIKELSAKVTALENA